MRSGHDHLGVAGTNLSAPLLQSTQPAVQEASVAPAPVCMPGGGMHLPASLTSDLVGLPHTANADAFAGSLSTSEVAHLSHATAPPSSLNDMLLFERMTAPDRSTHSERPAWSENCRLNGGVKRPRAAAFCGDASSTPTELTRINQIRRQGPLPNRHAMCGKGSCSDMAVDPPALLAQMPSRASHADHQHIRNLLPRQEAFLQLLNLSDAALRDQARTADVGPAAAAQVGTAASICSGLGATEGQLAAFLSARPSGVLEQLLAAVLLAPAVQPTSRDAAVTTNPAAAAAAPPLGLASISRRAEPPKVVDDAVVQPNCMRRSSAMAVAALRTGLIVDNGCVAPYRTIQILDRADRRSGSVSASDATLMATISDRDASGSGSGVGDDAAEGKGDAEAAGSGDGSAAATATKSNGRSGGGATAAPGPTHAGSRSADRPGDPSPYRRPKSSSNSLPAARGEQEGSAAAAGKAWDAASAIDADSVAATERPAGDLTPDVLQSPFSESVSVQLGSSLPPEVAARLKKKIRIIQPISRTWVEETLQGSTTTANASSGSGGAIGGGGAAGTTTAAASPDAGAALASAQGRQQQQQSHPAMVAGSGVSAGHVNAVVRPLQRQDSLLSGRTVQGVGPSPDHSDRDGPARGLRGSREAAALGFRSPLLPTTTITTASSTQEKAAANAVPAAPPGELLRDLPALVAATSSAPPRPPPAAHPLPIRQPLPLKPPGVKPEGGDAAQLPSFHGAAVSAAAGPGRQLPTQIARPSLAEAAPAAPMSADCLSPFIFTLPTHFTSASAAAGLSSVKMLSPHHGSNTTTAAGALPAATPSASDLPPFSHSAPLPPRATSGIIPGHETQAAAAAAFAAAAANTSPSAAPLGGFAGGANLSTLLGGASSYGAPTAAGSVCPESTDARSEWPVLGAAGMLPPKTRSLAQLPQSASSSCLGKVQGELTLLYQWYVANKTVYLEQAQRQLQRIDMLTAAAAAKDAAAGGAAAAAASPGAAAAAASARVESAEAMRAFETALKIMRVCGNVEQQWLTAPTVTMAPAADRGGDDRRLPLGPAAAPGHGAATAADQAAAATAAAAANRPNAASASPAGAGAAPIPTTSPGAASRPLLASVPAPSSGWAHGARAAVAVAAALVGSVRSGHGACTAADAAGGGIPRGADRLEGLERKAPRSGSPSVIAGAELLAGVSSGGQGATGAGPLTATRQTAGAMPPPSAMPRGKQTSS